MPPLLFVVTEMTLCSTCSELAMNELRCAIELNNTAVRRAFLHSNDCAFASANLSDFQRVVQAMRCLSDDTQTMFGSEQVANTTHQGSYGLCFTKDYPDCLAGRESDFGLVYNRPLFLPTDLSTVSPLEEESVVYVVTITALFNVAITVHEIGMRTGQEKALVKATRLYDLVLAVLDEWSEADDPSHKVLRYLTLNNQAQVLFSLGCYNEGQSRVSSMWDQLATTDHLGVLLESREAEALRLNAVYIHTPTTALAA